MTGINLLRDMCGGKVEGVEVGSNAVTLLPHAITGGEFVADTKTAGYELSMIHDCMFE